MQKLFFCAYIREKIDRFAVDSTLSVDCRIHFTTEKVIIVTVVSLFVRLSVTNLRYTWFTQ